MLGRALLGAVICWAVLSACGKTTDETGADGGGGASDPVAQAIAVCNDFTSAYCDWAVRCAQAETVAGCIAIESRLGLELSEGCKRSLAAGVADGRQTFNPASANSCLSQVRTSASCDGQATEGVESCRQATTGVVGSGGACFSSEDCQSGLYCAQGATCPGTCQVTKAAGALAESDEECQDGLYEYGGACKALAAGSASCAPIAPSGQPQSCVEGHFCDGASKTCKVKLAAAAACTRDDQCSGSLSCNAGLCSALAGLNQPCAYGQDAVDCKLDLTCVTGNFPAGTCQASPLSAGGSCQLDGECARDLYCANASFGATAIRGTCTARVAAGQPCGASVRCQAGNYCATTCQPFKALGASCTAERECGDHFCQGGVCVASSCEDTAP